MHKIRILLVLTQISAIFMAEYFDHAFRKHGNTHLDFKSQSINKDTSKLLKRVGIAMGEEDSDESEPIEEHTFLRRTGLLDDQEAVESNKSVRKLSIDQIAQSALNLIANMPDETKHVFEFLILFLQPAFQNFTKLNHMFLFLFFQIGLSLSRLATFLDQL